ncbi:MAG: hypothetical protein KKD77_23145 [Gammaproteobacteria bacterium]|nr:hypothetical protein [Gammaproteobacteria bacterium]
MTNEINTNEEQIREEINPLVETATAMTVTTARDKEGAVLFVRDINASIKKVKLFFEPMKKAAKAAHAAICDRENEVLSKVEKAKAMALGKISYFDQVQEKISLAEETRLRDKARQDHEKALEKAHAKLDAILSKSTDSQETIDLLSWELGRDDLNDIERQKIESQIEIETAKLENNQEKVEEVQQRIQEPVFMEPVIMPKEEKIKGAVSRKDYDIQITNAKAVIGAVANGVLPLSCVKINEAEIKKFIAMHGGQKAVPGVAFRQLFKTHVRG